VTSASLLSKLKESVRATLNIDPEATVSILEKYHYLDPSFKQFMTTTSSSTFIILNNQVQEVIINKSIYKWTPSALASFINNIETSSVILNTTYTLSVIQQCETFISRAKLLNSSNHSDSFTGKIKHQIHEIDTVINRLKNTIIDFNSKLNTAADQNNWGRYEFLSAGFASTEQKINKLLIQQDNLPKSLP
jgi:hypothetical protein